MPKDPEVPSRRQLTQDYETLVRAGGVDAPYEIEGYDPGHPIYEHWMSFLEEQAALDGIRLQRAGYVQTSHWCGLMLIAQPNGEPYELRIFSDEPSGQAQQELVARRLEAAERDYGEALEVARVRAKKRSLQRQVERQERAVAREGRPAGFQGFKALSSRW